MDSKVKGEEGASQPPLVFLRELMGDAWIDAELFGEEPRHLLGQWWKKGDQNPWVAYTESLAHEMLTSDKIDLDRAALAKKLKADYVSTLAEMEEAVFLLRQGFSVVLEPTYPEKGPDLRADWEDTGCGGGGAVPSLPVGTALRIRPSWAASNWYIALNVSPVPEI